MKHLGYDDDGLHYEGFHMKTLNTNEDCPSEFYIFVNFNNPITFNNIQTVGSISSSGVQAAAMGADMLAKYINDEIDYLPFLPNPNVSPAISMYQMNVLNNYRAEYNAELTRRSSFKTYPSRLSALYAFADYETCVEVSRKYGWSIETVRKFRLIEIPPLTRVVKVNMEVVSLIRLAYSVSGFGSDEEVWQHYWAGNGNIEFELPGRDFQPQRHESGVIWEYLIEGTLERID